MVGGRKLGLLAAALALCAPAPACAAEVRALFVGIDDYLYSETKVEGAGFADLRAAVSDVAQIKAALKSGYGFDLDRPKKGKCRSANAVSITLTDRCATRKAIFAALDDRIARSAPGDTLIFYFAGHGGQYTDDQVFDQASGFNTSILPADARKPGAASHSDILDREIRAVIDKATARGINFVTVFDSCHAEGAGRGGEFVEGQPRGGTPVITVPKSAFSPPPPVRAGESRGYRVHLAAARENEEAREIWKGELRGGIFTTALAETLAAMPNATFRDIAEEVRLKVDERGLPQHAFAEGALNATLGGEHRSATLLAASPSPSGVAIAGGRLSGVTEGSTFALFATSGAALDGKSAPLASGRITKVEASISTLVLDSEPAGMLPPRLVALETNHMFGTRRLLVRIDDGGRDTKAVAAAIDALPFARVGEPAQLLYAHGREGRLLTVGGVGIASLGDPADPAFAARLGDALRRIERVNALLALRTDPSAADARLCFADGAYDVFACDSPEPLAAPRAVAGRPAQLTVVNRSDDPRFLYVFAIDPLQGITLVLPPHGGTNRAVAPHQPLQRTITPPGGYAYRFVTIATDAPIDAAAFEQQGIASDKRDACAASLEPGRCLAASGALDPTASKVARWSVTASSAIVDPAEE